MINFMLPGMYEHADLNLRVINYMRSTPEIFYDNVQIGAVFGNFQYCIWDGGRIFPQYNHTNSEQMLDIIQQYNSLNIPIRYVFTSTILQPKHYTNRFCNKCLELAQNGFNEIVINDAGLEEYIKSHYPNYSFISSTTKCLNANDLKQELKKDYKYICLDYNLNHNFQLLESLTDNEKTKCEILVNAICPPGCINRKEHYRLNSLCYLNYNKPYRITSCPIKGNTLDPGTISYSTHVSADEIFTKYAPIGITNFKIEGRTLEKIEILGNYAHYLVKPEYQNYFMVVMSHDANFCP